MIKSLQIIATLIAAAAGPTVFFLFVLVIGLGITIYELKAKHPIPSVPWYRVQNGHQLRKGQPSKQS